MPSSCPRKNRKCRTRRAASRNSMRKNRSRDARRAARRATRRHVGGSWHGYTVEIALPEGFTLRIDGETGRVENYAEIPAEYKEGGFVPRPVSAPIRITHAQQGVFTYEGYLPPVFGSGEAWLVDSTGQIDEWPGASFATLQETIDLYPETNNNNRRNVRPVRSAYPANVRSVASANNNNSNSNSE